MKKKILSLSAALMIGTTSLLATDYQYLVFTMTDGTTQSITAQGTTMTFANGTLTVTNGTTTLNLPTAQLQKMEFSENGTAGIAAVSASAASSADAQIFDLQGRRMAQPLGSLPKGTYVIKVNGQSTKVQVR